MQNVKVGLECPHLPHEATKVHRLKFITAMFFLAKHTEGVLAAGRKDWCPIKVLWKRALCEVCLCRVNDRFRLTTFVYV